MRATIFLLIFYLTFIPSEAICVSSLMQNIPSLDYIVSKRHAEITLIQGDENYYVVSQGNEISDNEVNEKSDLIFGEDAITEDNILRHYIFNKDKMEKNRAYNKL